MLLDCQGFCVQTLFWCFGIMVWFYCTNLATLHCTTANLMKKLLHLFIALKSLACWICDNVKTIFFITEWEKKSCFMHVNA